MDDGNIVGHYKTVLKALEILKGLQDELGMYINYPKTELIWIAGKPPASNPFSSFGFKSTNVDEIECLGPQLVRNLGAMILFKESYFEN